MNRATSDRYHDALLFTAEQFRHKIRKGSGIPYLTHLLSVAALVAEGGGDEDQQIAGLLHDWLEDIPGASQEVLVARYGERVNRLVVACSDCFGEPKPPWKERKDSYLAHLRESSPEVKLISVCDKLHNCRSTVVDLRLHGPKAFDSFNAGRDGTLWYYQALVPALATHGWEHWLLDDLRREVEELVRLG